MTVKLLQGDCRALMAAMDEASVDAVVTDPPYELGFMGRGWDSAGVAHDPRTWAAALRVAKPGAYLVAFGGTRTFHRLACAIEDAGWELRDTFLRGHAPQPAEDCPWLLAWGYGSGFPKSHNGPWGGTAAKPAWEPIVLARKPLIGTVEENWRAHGTGAMNIDGCRIAPVGDGDYAYAPGDEYEGRTRPSGFALSAGRLHESGRWPANLVHDGSPELLACFPQTASGMMRAGTMRAAQDQPGSVCFGTFGGNATSADTFGDAGSAARFFYCAKATVEDREEGCDGLPQRVGGMVSNTSGQHITRRDGGEPGARGNHHPTVKPTELMRWLCRLVTPRGGGVLDPFMGSGSTGKAAVLEGFGFIGMDLSPEYLEIARARITFAQRQGHQPSLLEAA